MNDFSKPQNYTLEKYKEHTLLLPLDFNFQISSFQKNSAKEWKKMFFQHLIKHALLNQPDKNKKQCLQETQENFNNLMSIVRNNLRDTEPLLTLAYPIANCWIVVFFSDYFNKAKKLDVASSIKEVNYNPIEYAYKVTF